MTRGAKFYLYQLNSVEWYNKYNINIRHRIPNFKRDNKKLGEFVTLRDIEIVNVTVDMLSMVCRCKERTNIKLYTRQ